ncbi:hypothetical protein [Porphyromonas crevioricanis]|nr:hypothetical protein [Porphyromonas crevioricanis]
MRRKNYMLRLWLLLLVVALATVALYFLPEQVGSWQIKKVDLLSDLRVEDDSSQTELARQSMLSADFMERRRKQSERQPQEEAGFPVRDSLAMRDSVYQHLRKQNPSDSTLALFEDYSPSHTGLKRLFSSLRSGSSLGRPVRIAVLGDSFIEGDIFTAHLRKMLQRKYGGGGVGWMPITSQVAGFRSTISHQFSGWKTMNMLHSKGKHNLSGYYFLPQQGGSSVSYKLPGDSSSIHMATRISLYYQAERGSTVSLKTVGDSTVVVDLRPTEGGVGEYRWQGNTKRVRLSVPASDGLSILGMSLEHSDGISVDNFSLRGNSGLALSKIDVATSSSLCSLRPYDLIVLQYGLNVANAKQLNYDNYYKQMLSVVAHLRKCFPGSDIMLMGVSDRAQRSTEGFVTMPAIHRLLAAQRRIAMDSGIVFWNTFLAMGGDGSMVRMVAQGQAAKDYTHISFAGGKKIAEAFVRAFELEKKYYDAIE